MSGCRVGWPELVAVSVPRCHLGVECDRPCHVEPLHRGSNVGWQLLEGELRRVDADDQEAATTVRVLRLPQVWDGAHAIDT